MSLNLRQRRGGRRAARSWRHAEAGGAAALFVGLQLWKIGDPITGAFTWRYTHTALGIRSLMRGSLNPFTMEVPIMGAPWQLPTEFPIFQVIAAMVGRLIGLDAGSAGQVTAIMMWLLLGFLTYRLMLELFDLGVARIVVVLHFLSPFALEQGIMVLPDSTATCLGVASVLLARRQSTWSTRTGPFVLALVMTAALLAKVFVGFLWALLAVGLVTLCDKNWRQRFALHLVLSTLTVIAYYGWNNYSQSVYDRGEFSSKMGPRDHYDYVFGTLGSRLDFDTLRNSVDKVAQKSVGSIALLALFAMIALASTVTVRHLGALMGIFLAGPLVFTGTWVRHDYYYIGTYPALLAVVGVAVMTVVRLGVTPRDATSAPRHRLRMVAATLPIVALGVLSPKGAEIVRQWRIPPPQLDVGHLSKFTDESDLIIVMNAVPGDGATIDPQVLYVADRRGLMYADGFVDREILENAHGVTDFTHLFVTGTATALTLPQLESFLPRPARLVPVTNDPADLYRIEWGSS